ncbi:hypothetical protein ACFQ80_19110 [Isoptericola sp. NPDC056578]|uniref:hypothetical protein n=1 Tax=Isoptericola sp. NPDC056578 TaxID=3345870 RepID=UPI0036898AA3
MARADDTGQGLLRLTTARTVTCTCRSCGRRFTSTGAAASHARGQRHAVAVDYRTSFTYVPAEVLDRALTGAVS